MTVQEGLTASEFVSVGATDAEIIQAIGRVHSDSPFQFRSRILARALTYDEACKHVEHPGDEWDGRFMSDPLAEVYNWMPDAINAVRLHRGVTTELQVQSFWALMYIYSPQVHATIDWDCYRQYGAPVLKQVAAAIGYPWPLGDERLERMAAGYICEPGCIMGCQIGEGFAAELDLIVNGPPEE